MYFFLFFAQAKTYNFVGSEFEGPLLAIHKVKTVAKCQGRPTQEGGEVEEGGGGGLRRRLRLIRCPPRAKKHFPSGRSDNAIKQIQQNTFIMPFGFSLYHRLPLSAAGNKSRARGTTTTTRTSTKA